jgi:branched-chain amino acid transport system substrate-binding protein
VSQMNRRQALKLLAALGATGLAAACADNDGSEGSAVANSDVPVKIGLLVPQTGGLKAIGEEIVRGFQLYLDLNDGRLGGHPVQLETAAEGETAAAGIAGLKELLGKGVLAVSGVVSPTVMLAIRDTIRQAKVPLIGSDASPVSVQGEVYIWRTSYVSNDAARAIGPYVAERVRGKVVMVLPDRVIGQDLIEGFREGFGATDSRLAADPIFAGDDTNPRPGYYTPAMDALKAARPDAVFCSFSGAAAVEFVRQYRRADIPATIYAAGHLTEGTSLVELGGDAAGIVTAMNYSPDLPNNANRAFTTAYRGAHNASPTTYAMASFDAAQTLDKAILLAGEKPTPQQVNLMLGKVGQIDSPRGNWQFNQSRTPQQKWYLREVRRDGQVLSNVLISELNTIG